MVRSDANGPRALCLGCGCCLWGVVAGAEGHGARAALHSSEAWLRARACRPWGPVCGLWVGREVGAKGRATVAHLALWLLVVGLWPVTVWITI
jgi:hypothetical protein